MEQLKPSDFEKVIQNEYSFYFKHEYIGYGVVYELDLEPCLEGFEVANYIKNDGDYTLTEPKYCTRVDLQQGLGIAVLEAWTRALAMASFYKSKYAYQMQKSDIENVLSAIGPRPSKVRS